MTDIETPAPGISRRAILGGTAGTIAAVWAAPAITSLGSSAGAASAVCSGTICGFDAALCGASGPVGDCFCQGSLDGKSICMEDYYCEDTANHPACTHDSDCASGWICSTDACSGCDSANGHCAAPCGSNIASTTSTGKRASGK
jgi:hypothetical protein